MRLRALALDYDGTIAHDGVPNPEVRAAIAEARARGVVVLIVTGRILSELRDLTGDLRFVDAVVAENGAVLAFPAAGRTNVLGEPPPAAFVEALRRRGVEVGQGECVVEAPASAAMDALALVRELELPLVPIFNRDRLMVLPRGISKATGLRQALGTLRLSPHNAIGIGDAENDHELLRACEVGVAVAWGSEALKARADHVLQGNGPKAVAAYIRDATANPRLGPASVGRRRLTVGRAGQRLFSLAVRGRNVLVTGDPRSGKSWVTGLLCEQLILHEYSLCVIDPEGDYTGLEELPGVVVLGGHRGAPSPRELLRAFQQATATVIVDLSRLQHQEKIEYIATLLPTLAELRRRRGVPHRIIVDEAHYFLNEPDALRLLDLELDGYTLTSYQPTRMHPAILARSEARVVTRTTDPAQVAALARTVGADGKADAWQAMLGSLGIGEAVVLPGAAETGTEPVRVTLVERLTSHVRHREKYMDVPVRESRAFVFTRGGHQVGSRVRTLRAFIDELATAPTDVVREHARRGDFARWVGDVFGDHGLASAIGVIEERAGIGWTVDLQDALIAAVRERYDLSR
jgi:3-deoxy-D-manno-octulosonate 8-phosphate phosphatase KdsC-like HAD superfamily phosphatase